MRGELKGMSKDKPLKRNDHLMDAMRYLCALQPRHLKAGGFRMTASEAQQYARVNSYTG
jgi:hypothetical protein